MNENKNDVPDNLYNYDYIHHVCDKKEIIKDVLDVNVVDIEKQVRKVKRKRLRQDSFNYGYILLALIFVLSIGFAYLFTNMETLSTFGTKANSWKIKFENLEVVKDKNTVAGNEIQIVDDTTINFEVNLLKPKDTYSFVFDVVNEGTIDAMVGKESLVILNGDEEVELPSFIQYNLEYVDYDLDVKTHQLLEKQDRKKLKFTITRNDIIENTDLEESDIDYKFSLKLEYRLASDDIGIEVE